MANVDPRAMGSSTSEPMSELDVIYEDDHLIAIDKPAGLLVHRTKLDAYETRFALQLLRDQVGYRVFPIHRLDKPTSGVLLFGRSAEDARVMSDLFAVREVTKEYLAIVRGWTDEKGCIDYPLKEIRDRTTDGKARTDKPAQPAVTSYATLATTEIDATVGRYETARYSLLSINPETGRKNQVRRHFKHIFHPIIGDRKFGDRAHNAYFRESLGVDRMLLAATALSFTHPWNGQPLRIATTPPFPTLVERLFPEHKFPLHSH